MRSWREPSSALWERAELLDNGDLLVVGVNAFDETVEGIPDDARYLMRLSWNGAVIWKRSMNAHHDIELTPRGQLLALTFQRRRFPSIHPDIDTRDDQLTLLDHQGNVLSVRSLIEIIRTNPQAFLFTRVKPERAGGAEWVDLLHANSVEWMPYKELAGRHPLYANNSVLICFRHQDRVAMINWDSGRLLWSWGLGVLSGPHDARWLENGHILIFDNGLRRRRSRVIELDPISEQIIWEYKDPIPEYFFTLSKGSSQRLPNNNTLIANSDNGQAFETTPEGQIVWMFNCPHTNEENRRATIVRMTRYDQALVDGIRSRAGADGSSGP